MVSAFWIYFLIAKHEERPFYHVHMVTSRSYVKLKWKTSSLITSPAVVEHVGVTFSESAFNTTVNLSLFEAFVFTF